MAMAAPRFPVAPIGPALNLQRTLATAWRDLAVWARGLSHASLSDFSDWAAWNPAWTGITVGNGTTIAYWTQLGRVIFFEAAFTLGSTSAVTGSIGFASPTAMNSVQPAGMYLGPATFFDASAPGHFQGFVLRASGSSMLVHVNQASGTYGVAVATAAAIPMTWTTNDAVRVSGFYVL